MTTDKICIYHGNCADGFGAAYAVWLALGDDCTYVPASYGQKPPDVYGKQVYMVDFSYKRGVLLNLAARALSIVILDHHDTAEKELVDLPSNVEVLFDQSKSGAVLAWEHFHKAPVPYLLQLVQDRDLWQFKLPETKQVTAALFSYDWTFEMWDAFTYNPQLLQAEGEALLRKQNKDVQALCEPHHVDTSRFTVAGVDVDVPTVNCPWMYASDVGHELCVRYPEAPFSVTYLVGADKVKFSLRSNGKAHCGEVAQAFGGGGHPNAAGFSLTHKQFAKGFTAAVARREASTTWDK